MSVPELSTLVAAVQVRWGCRHARLPASPAASVCGPPTTTRRWEAADKWGCNVFGLQQGH